jgi:hypothetical protein
MAGMAMAIVMDGVVAVVAMGMEMDTVDTGTVDMVDTNLDIRNPMATRNLSMSRPQCTILLSNRPASVCFFRLILVGRYRLKRANVK